MSKEEVGVVRILTKASPILDCLIIRPSEFMAYREIENHCEDLGPRYKESMGQYVAWLKQRKLIEENHEGLRITKNGIESLKEKELLEADIDSY